jgi:hypothetical protein
VSVQIKHNKAPFLTSVKLSLVVSNLLSGSWNSVQTLFFTAAHVQIAVFVLVLFLVHGMTLTTHSIQRHGSAGIQNSVLSLDCSNREDILVNLVCSISGL